MVGAAPTGHAGTTSEWSTILLNSEVRLKLEVFRYYLRGFNGEWDIEAFISCSDICWYNGLSPIWRQTIVWINAELLGKLCYTLNVNVYV